MANTIEIHLVVLEPLLAMESKMAVDELCASVPETVFQALKEAAQNFILNTVLLLTRENSRSILAMRFQFHFFATLATLLQLCSANFDLYFVDFQQGDGFTSIWQVFQNDPSCNEVIKAEGFAISNDVSGSKKGIRCVGACNRSARPGDITVLEMHFKNNPLYHWTIYKDRNYEMYGLDGKVYGRCIPFPDYNFHCNYDRGNRKFRCLTQFTAKDLLG
ncbi:hypothetical protein HJFPF1_07675 [Paramyrothecium foliicola]|nr:hypothetical protein HJFPF1_07675 [Paramyrothecium foliicola]